MTREETINLIRFAIEVAGDGGMQPFTEEEYKQMYDFLDELSENQSSQIAMEE